jgi:hypothetical protein
LEDFGFETGLPEEMANPDALSDPSNTMEALTKSPVYMRTKGRKHPKVGGGETRERRRVENERRENIYMEDMYRIIIT